MSLVTVINISFSSGLLLPISRDLLKFSELSTLFVIFLLEVIDVGLITSGLKLSKFLR